MVLIGYIVIQTPTDFHEMEKQWDSQTSSDQLTVKTETAGKQQMKSCKTLRLLLNPYKKTGTHQSHPSASLQMHLWYKGQNPRCFSEKLTSDLDVKVTKIQFENPK